MNQNSPKGFLIALSTLRAWLVIVAAVWLLGAIGLGWLVKSFFALIGIILLAPVAIFVGVRWWIQRNLVQGQCPVCASPLAGLNKTQMRCPNCNEPIKVEHKHFSRLTPPGTIDVQAVEVGARTLEE